MFASHFIHIIIHLIIICLVNISHTIRSLFYVSNHPFLFNVLSSSFSSTIGTRLLSLILYQQSSLLRILILFKNISIGSMSLLKWGIKNVEPVNINAQLPTNYLLTVIVTAICFLFWMARYDSKIRMRFSFYVTKKWKIIPSMYIKSTPYHA